MRMRFYVVGLFALFTALSLAGPIGCGADTTHGDVGTNADKDTIDATSFATMQASIERLRESLPPDQERAFRNGVAVLFTQMPQIDPSLSKDELHRRATAHMHGLTAAEVIAVGKDQPELITEIEQSLEKTKRSALRHALQSKLSTVRAQIRFWHEHTGGDGYPDLAAGWDDLTERFEYDGRTIGPYLRRPAYNPCTADGLDQTTVTDDPDAIGPETAWLYDRLTGEIRAVVSHQLAVEVGLMPVDSLPGEAHPDIVSY
jgi:hypothetical protein